jgi:hypothetical protein
MAGRRTIARARGRQPERNITMIPETLRYTSY